MTAAHAEVGQLVDLLAQALAGVLDDAGQRGDRLRLVDALAHEQRGDELAHVEAGLGDELAHRDGATQAARAGHGELTGHTRSVRHCRPRTRGLAACRRRALRHRRADGPDQ